MRHAMIAAAVAATLSTALLGCKDEKTSAPPAANPPANAPAAAPTTAPAATGTPSLPAAVDDYTAKYAEYAKQVGDAMQNKKWDEAETAMKKLEDIKSKLSPDLQKAVEGLRTGLNAQKALQTGGIPGIPSTTQPSGGLPSIPGLGK